MIEMSCPRCGAGGRVPRDKVNARLVCKKCLQVFHLTPSLHPVLGEPPAARVATKVREVREDRERAELEIPGLSGLGEKLGRIKLPDAKIVAAVAVVGLIIGFFSWLFSKPSVEQRCDALSQAIRSANMDAAVGMSLPGTELEAMKWLGDVYKRYIDLKFALGNVDPGVQVQVQYNSDGSAQALLRFGREGAVSTGPLSIEQAATLEPPSDGKKSMELRIHWSKDTWGSWRLDGKQTAESATRSG